MVHHHRGFVTTRAEYEAMIHMTGISHVFSMAPIRVSEKQLMLKQTIGAILQTIAENQSLCQLVDEFEREYIARVLAAFPGNRDKVAEVLGISRSTLFRKLRKHSLG